MPHGLFSESLFDGDGLGDDLGSSAVVSQSLDNLERQFADYELKWSASYLRLKGVRTYVATPTSDGGYQLTFYGEDQQPSSVAPFRIYRRGDEAVAPPPGGGKTSTPVYAEGDGLLPASTEGNGSGSPKWLPWALLGGGLLVAGGIVYASSRKTVTANRRRRTYRRKRR
jgi:hypothetical protein